MPARPFETEITNFIAALAALSVLNQFTPAFSKLGGFFSSSPPEVIVEGLKDDRFNAATVEDFVDGTPTLSAGPFWEKVFSYVEYRLIEAQILCLPSSTGKSCYCFSCKG